MQKQTKQQTIKGAHAMGLPSSHYYAANDAKRIENAQGVVNFSLAARAVLKK